MVEWAFVQAGGRSARMGTDKAWVKVEGRALIRRVLAAVQPAADRRGIVINRANPGRARYEALAAEVGAELLFDRHDYRGPLGGIDTALRQCGAQAASALIVACDLPFVTSDFFALLDQIHEYETNDLTLPVDAEGRAQPLAAVYSSRCLLAVTQLLQQDVRRVDQLYEHVRTRRVEFAEYQSLPDAGRLLRNLNRPEDLMAERAWNRER